MVPVNIKLSSSLLWCRSLGGSLHLSRAWTHLPNSVMNKKWNFSKYLQKRQKLNKLASFHNPSFLKDFYRLGRLDYKAQYSWSKIHLEQHLLEAYTIAIDTLCCYNMVPDPDSRLCNIYLIKCVSQSGRKVSFWKFSNFSRFLNRVLYGFIPLFTKLRITILCIPMDISNDSKYYLLI